MLVFLNEHANGGRGKKRWEDAQARLREAGFDGHDPVVSAEVDFDAELQRELAQGEGKVVAAGGDGTVNLVLNHLMKLAVDERERVTLGAVGIGSSNDFHKNGARNLSRSSDVPVRLSWQKTRPHNVGQVDLYDQNHVWKRHYFLVNCSVGALAEANRIFNEDRGSIQWLKSRWLNGAIGAAGMCGVFGFPNTPVMVRSAEQSLRVSFTSLSVLISPHISGGLCMDVETGPDADRFGVALCEEMSAMRRLYTFASLARGRFTGLPRTRTWHTREIEILPQNPLPLEMDGEVFGAQDIHVRMLKGAVRVCCC